MDNYDILQILAGSWWRTAAAAKLLPPRAPPTPGNRTMKPAHARLADPYESLYRHTEGVVAIVPLGGSPTTKTTDARSFAGASGSDGAGSVNGGPAKVDCVQIPASAVGRFMQRFAFDNVAERSVAKEGVWKAKEACKRLHPARPWIAADGIPYSFETMYQENESGKFRQ